MSIAEQKRYAVSFATALVTTVTVVSGVLAQELAPVESVSSLSTTVPESEQTLAPVQGLVPAIWPATQSGSSVRDAPVNAANTGEGAGSTQALQSAQGAEAVQEAMGGEALTGDTPVLSLQESASDEDLLPDMTLASDPESDDDPDSELVQQSAPAKDRTRPAETVSRKTRDFLSDPARTGSLVGTIIAGAAIPNPLSPLLGSVLGFIIGKRSSYTSEDESGNGRTVARRGFAPPAGESVPSIAGLATGSSPDNTISNPFVDASSDVDSSGPLALTATRDGLVPGATEADGSSIALALPGSAPAKTEPVIAPAMPAIEVGQPGALPAPDSEEDIVTAVPRHMATREMPTPFGAVDADRPVAPASYPASGAGQTPVQASATHETGQRVVVPVEASAAVGSGEPLITNRPEQMVKTTYDPAGVEALKRLRRQLAESCSKGNHEKPTTSRCYYLAQ